MSKKPILTVSEFAKMGGRATLRKYGKRQLRAWGKLGGRPKKDSRVNARARAESRS